MTGRDDNVEDLATPSTRSQAARDVLRAAASPAGLGSSPEAAMTHVYFHCSNAEELYLDKRGVEVDDLIEAHHRATQVVRDFINSHGPHDWRAWTLHVIDEDGDELFMMPFSYMLGKPH
jgi:hypothetical protein